MTNRMFVSNVKKTSDSHLESKHLATENKNNWTYVGKSTPTVKTVEGNKIELRKILGHHDTGVDHSHHDCVYDWLTESQDIVS